MDRQHFLKKDLRPLRHRHHGPFGCPGVIRPRPDDPVVVELLDHMSAPTGHPAQYEQGCVEFNGQPHVVIEPCTWPVQVRAVGLFHR